MSSLIEFRQDGSTARVPLRPEKMAEIDDGAGTRLAEGTIGKKRGWPKGKPRTRKTKLAVLGVPSHVLDSGNPAYARCVRLASAYRKVRVRELTVNFGYVSSGASALLASAAHALAASRFLYEEAAKASGADMLELLKTASKLSDSARANELAAWELSSRESIARKKLHAIGSGTPWIIQPEDGKKKRGRPRKDRDAEVLEHIPALPPPGSELGPWVQTATVTEGESDGTLGSGPAEEDGRTEASVNPGGGGQS